MKPRIARAVLFLSALVALLSVQCKRSEKKKETERVSRLTGKPVEHRPAVPQCHVPRANDPLGPNAPRGTACHADEDCTKGTEGRCVRKYEGMGGIANQCTYDECWRDVDCGHGKVCNCRSHPGEWFASTCVDALCRTDADCESAFCGPSSTNRPGDGFLVGWACHTPADECFDAADCQSFACAYRPATRRFECVPGRSD